MTRKQLTIVAGILVLAAGIGFVATRPSHGPLQNTSGAIGVAQRYHSDQISDKDVQLTDAQVQAFLQSDTFHKIATNPEFRKAVTSGELSRALNVDGAGLMFQDPAVLQLVRTGAFQKFESDAGLSQLAASDAFATFAADAQGHAGLVDAMKAIVADDHARAIVGDTQLATVLSDANVRSTLQSDAFSKVVASGELGRLAQVETFNKLMADAARIGKGDTGLQSMIEANHEYVELSKSVDYQKLVQQDGLNKLIDGGFAKLYTAGDVGARLTDYQAICKDAAGLAAISSDAFSRWVADASKATTDAGLASRADVMKSTADAERTGKTEYNNKTTADVGRTTQIEYNKSLETGLTSKTEYNARVDAARQLVASYAFSKFLSDAGLRNLANDAGFVTALQNDAMQHALTDANVRGTITSPEFQKLVASGDCVSLAGRPEFLAAVRDGALQKAVESAE